MPWIGSNVIMIARATIARAVLVSMVLDLGSSVTSVGAGGSSAVAGTDSKRRDSNIAKRI
jgi:hypothetical protein